MKTVTDYITHYSWSRDAGF